MKSGSILKESSNLISSDLLQYCSICLSLENQYYGNHIERSKEESPFQPFILWAKHHSGSPKVNCSNKFLSL